MAGLDIRYISTGSYNYWIFCKPVVLALVQQYESTTPSTKTHAVGSKPDWSFVDNDVIARRGNLRASSSQAWEILDEEYFSERVTKIMQASGSVWCGNKATKAKTSVRARRGTRLFLP